ncbi:MAG: UDP-N-acetyl-D-glucosamine dehydrogenase [Candidatus Kentron sp. G]|nr:MAG: UDP-N-acetyl-D-glucosamine dehydrogenase [Candidatus Kentron sp. G]VFN01700.1 MAG: UDP-N-acetyl-D-glucosamine dehydrogenase [Candidatus Kentron sp. G]VFN03846.1 MAG: UDP-N-acetyl-D-glucosamine dehydrogenase [Candidatus Kentron sp. G]
MKTTLIEKLEDKTAVIGIIGLGYVGLPLLLQYCETGYQVIGFDIDGGKIDSLSRGKSPIGHIPDVAIRNATQNIRALTSDFSLAAEADALILCVPTPLNRHREPDIGHIIDTMDALVPRLRPGQIVSLESTTYPGTTDEELLPRLESRGFTVGRDIFLVFSPEREDPGNPDFSTRTIPKVCGGYSPACLEAGLALYSRVVDKVVPVGSTRVAELTKLLENIHRAVNIGLVNEMKILADRMGIDIHEVIRAAATKPFGFVPYYPGPGLGGHCVPIDPFYLTWKAREYGLHTRFIELAGEVNSAMPDYVIAKAASALNSVKKAINGSRILILGLAYKKNVDDTRESPSLVLMEKLCDLGADIAYSDPYIPVFPGGGEPVSGLSDRILSSVTLTPETLAGFDCVLLATDHDEFDYGLIKENAKLIVDCRGRYLEPSGHRIIKA